MCGLAASEIRRCNKYLGIVPWLLVTADTIKGAKECVSQINDHMLADHDPVTRWFVERVGNDMSERANGGECSAALAEECRALDDSTLNEIPGESVHRGLTHEKTRAEASTTVHLKQSIRNKGTIKLIRAFIREHKERGKAVVRYEWGHVKRILQVHRKRRWRQKRITLRNLLRRVYREDDMARENWSSVLSRVPLERPAEAPKTTRIGQMQNEFLAATLVPNTHYRVDHQITARNEAGLEVAVDSSTFFTVVNATSSKSNRKFMHTVQTADDTEHLPFTVEVKFMDRWDDDSDARANGPVRVYAQADPEWLLPARITSFDNWVKQLWRYGAEAPDPEEKSVVVWSGCRRGKPVFPLEDERCPTYNLIYAVQGAGWTPSPAYHLHHAILPVGGSLPYDSRESTSQKWYYRTLLELPRCLPLSDGGIPSVHPAAFYKLVLRGDRVKTGLTSREYVLQFNRGKLKSNDDVLPLEDGGEAPPNADGGDFFPPPLGPPAPKPKPRAQAGLSRPGKGGGRGKAGAAKDPPPIEGGGGDGGGGSGGAGGGGAGGAAGAGEGGGDAGGGGAVGPEDFLPPPLADWKVGDEVVGIDGRRLRYTNYMNKKGKREPNWSIKCDRCPPEAACGKRRGAIPQFEKAHGVIEPPAFLQVWHDMPWPSHPSKKNHRAEAATDEAVARYVAEHREELEDICRKAGR